MQFSDYKDLHHQAKQVLNSAFMWLDMVVHTFNPGIRKEEAGGSLDFEASLFFKVISGTAKATQ